MKSVALLVLLFAVACTKRNPAACCTTVEDCVEVGLPAGSDCQDNLSCVFGTCILATCTSDGDCPGEVPRCETTAAMCVECLDSSECGDQICNASFQCAACVSDDECLDGFCDDGSCRATIVPKFLPTICDERAPGEVALASFNTTSQGENCTDIVVQPSGPELCVIHGSTLTIPSGEAIGFSGGRAVVLVADDDLIVEGTIDVSANRASNGPGGGLIISGIAATATAGGGGAGFGAAGGAGGTAVNGGAGAGGSAVDTTAIFQGGARAGGDVGGGGGGGAVMLVSCRGTVRVSGLIDAGGGGGVGGASNGPNVLLGGIGGGSGGLIVIQATAIEISGQVFANGGGGGGGAITTALSGGTRRGEAGENGTRSFETAAAGGTISATSGTVSGGSGGVGAQLAGGGSALTPRGSSSGAGPGGGGGGVGALQLHLPANREADTTGAIISSLFGAFVLSTK